MNTKELIKKMLLENTGKHMCDSGFENGRMWQRNKDKDFDNEPQIEKVYHNGVFEYFTISLYHYLSDLLELDSIANDINSYIDSFNEDLRKEDRYSSEVIHWTGDLLDTGLLEANYGAENVSQSYNTYNGEDNLSQVCQYFTFTIGEESYIALQIHGGADVRGGYTRIQVFKLNGFFTGTPDVYGSVTKEDGTTIEIDTYYNGYSLTEMDSGDEVEILETDNLDLCLNIMEETYMYH